VPFLGIAEETHRAKGPKCFLVAFLFAESSEGRLCAPLGQERAAEGGEGFPLSHVLTGRHLSSGSFGRVEERLDTAPAIARRLGRGWKEGPGDDLDAPGSGEHGDQEGHEPKGPAADFRASRPSADPRGVLILLVGHVLSPIATARNYRKGLSAA